MTELNKPHETWSEIRQAHLPAFEARLYLERAGLEPAEAVKWWESYIFSQEAADAIAAGRTIAEELGLQRDRHAAQRRTRQEQARAERQRDEAKRQQAEDEKRRLHREARRRLEREAEGTNFLDGLSEETVSLISKVRTVSVHDFLGGSEDDPVLYAEAVGAGRFVVTTHRRTAISDEFNAGFKDLLVRGAELSSWRIAISIEPRDKVDAAQLLSAPELFDLLFPEQGDKIVINGHEFLVWDELVTMHDAEQGKAPDPPGIPDGDAFEGLSPTTVALLERLKVVEIDAPDGMSEPCMSQVPLVDRGWCLRADHIMIPTVDSSPMNDIGTLGRPYRYTWQTFAEVLRYVDGCCRLDVEGLSAPEFAALLSAPEYVDILKFREELHINGAWAWYEDGEWRMERHHSDRNI